MDTLKELGLSTSYDEDLLKTTRINTSTISELHQKHNYVNNSDSDDSDNEDIDEGIFHIIILSLFYTNT